MVKDWGKEIGKARIFYAPGGSATVDLAYHDHAYNIELIGFFGRLINSEVLVKPSDDDYQEYEYRSALRHEDGSKLTPKEKVRITNTQVQSLRKGLSLKMPHTAIHTVSIQPKPTAWMVIEGPKVKQATRMISKKLPSFDGLYQPLELGKAKSLLADIVSMIESEQCE